MKPFTNQSGTLNVGHICTCGKECKWPPYVFAHWDIVLSYTCECGIKCFIFQGNVTLKDTNNV